jgi:hypothetical protein
MLGTGIVRLSNPVAIFLCFEELLAHFSHQTLPAVESAVPHLVLRTIAASHLQALRSIRELHCRHGRGGNGLDDNRPSAEKHAGAGQDLQRGDPGSESVRERWIGRPDSVFNPRRRCILLVVFGDVACCFAE